MNTIQAKFREIREKIALAEAAAGRPAGSVRLLAVSKGQPTTAIREALAVGQQDFGENYLNDALPKMDALTEQECHWHYIGQIQSNKTRTIATRFDWVESVDRERIARRLNQARADHARPLAICLQVNPDREAGKGGCQSLADTRAVAAVVAELPQLELRGLMAIPAPRHAEAEQRAIFKEIHHWFETLRADHPRMDTLSMGMTADFHAAILEGATQIRIGTALFGERRR